jgi:hypothetical protein
MRSARRSLTACWDRHSGSEHSRTGVRGRAPARWKPTYQRHRLYASTGRPQRHFLIASTPTQKATSAASCNVPHLACVVRSISTGHHSRKSAVPAKTCCAQIHTCGRFPLGTKVPGNRGSRSVTRMACRGQRGFSFLAKWCLVQPAWQIAERTCPGVGLTGASPGYSAARRCGLSI